MIQRALYSYHLQQRFHANYRKSEQGFHGIIAKSKSMQEIFRFIELVALSDISVLTCGESGTGKELVSHAIHQQSERIANPFVVLIVGAIPENLMESELVGHENGAFTGAHPHKR